jgi:hypothetical protein
MFEGKGTYTYPDKSRYEGGFKEGTFAGMGTLNEDGMVYAGDFKKGKPAGKGTMTYLDKSQEIGEWKDGQFLIKKKIKPPKQKKGASSEEEGLFAEEEWLQEDSDKTGQEAAQPFFPEPEPFNEEDTFTDEQQLSQDSWQAEQETEQPVSTENESIEQNENQGTN